jgi:rhodanese-related sulfurtransferase
MKVTTFGSCRLDPLHTLFEVTPIQSNLTYPHYTKEIIQAIEFCKGISSLHPSNTSICFRSGILNKSELNPNQFMNDFNTTQLFVLEIASRISYEYENTYVHHILTEEQYGFCDKDNIKERILSDIEIENDLIRIRELLYPKPFIVVSHIYTYNRGSRYNLVCLLKNLTTKLGIPFMDPTNALIGFDNIYLKEALISHYTDYGKELIAKEYKKKIIEVLTDYINEEKNNLTQIYYTDENKITKHKAHGFGDYLKGCCFLYDFCKENNRIFNINFSHHYLSKLLYCKSYRTYEETQETAYAFWNGGGTNDYEDNLYKYKNIFTNMGHTTHGITDNMREFIINNALLPRLEFQTKINALKAKLNINDNNYTIIHIRTGDHYLVKHKDNNSNIENIAVFIIQTLHINNIDITNNNIIFISDNNKLENIFANYSLKTPNLKKGHTGYNNNTLEDITDTLLDFFLMTTAKEIIQFSPYGWGSGFSSIIHDLYKVPIRKVQFPDSLYIE